MIYEYQCLNGHVEDHFEHHVEDKGTTTVICSICQNTMAIVPAFGRGNLFFEEGRGRWIHNLGPQPVFVTSPSQHKKLMKEAGVVEAGGYEPKFKYRNPKYAKSSRIQPEKGGRWI